MESWYVVVSDGNERDYDFARVEKHRALAMYVLVFHKGLSREDRQDIRDKWVRAFTTSDAYGMENLLIFEEDRVFLPEFWTRILLHIDERHHEWPLKRSPNGAPVAVFVTAENPCGFVCGLMERVQSMLVVIWLHSCSDDYKLAAPKKGDHGLIVCDGSFATMMSSRRW